MEQEVRQYGSVRYRAHHVVSRADVRARAGGGVVKVIHYDAAANRVIIIHEVPRLAPRMLRFASPLGGR